MTSANFPNEPIIYKDNLKKLKNLSDYILTHDRAIKNFSDDTVAQIYENKPYIIRRSRGFVPLPVELPFKIQKTVLALGGMLRTTFTFINKDKAFLSQYIGNTDSLPGIKAEKEAISHFKKIFSFEPDVIVIDKHPEYPNRKIADDFKDRKIVEIQHHKAHIGALLAENSELDPIIGVSMDGTGYGDDGNIWGGEFFAGDFKQLKRFGHLKYFFLPSGDKSVKEPWRYTLSLLYNLYNDSENTKKFADKFGKSSYPNDTYNYSIEKNKNLLLLNLLPSIDDIINDKKSKNDKAFIFHNTLAKGIVKMIEIESQKSGIKKVGLTGGIFQNLLLLKLTKDILQKRNFKVLTHSKIPSNDGGISLGQAFIATGKLYKEN
jgi:hydrogenase maturation protein HypF